ncbi:Hypothetical_protein [Hexamita inflata]|uniref:Hypothetical_protein n=1 Tax=Hexamita inflata TaxID=28002 RepID=A0ABP1JGN5_9EUKA
MHLYIGIAYLIITWIHIYICLYFLPKALLIWFSVLPSVLLIFNGSVRISGQEQQIVSIMFALIGFFSLVILKFIQLTTEKQIRNHEQLDQLHTQEVTQSSYSTSKKFTVAFILKDFIMSMHSINDKQYLFTKLMFNLKLIQKSVLEQSIVIWKSSLEEQTICVIMMIDMYNIKFKSPELKQQLKTFCMNIVRQKQQVQQLQYKHDKVQEQPIKVNFEIKGILELLIYEVTGYYFDKGKVIGDPQLIRDTVQIHYNEYNLSMLTQYQTRQLNDLITSLISKAAEYVNIKNEIIEHSQQINVADQHLLNLFDSLTTLKLQLTNQLIKLTGDFPLSLAAAWTTAHVMHQIIEEERFGLSYLYQAIQKIKPPVESDKVTTESFTEYLSQVTIFDQKILQKQSSFTNTLYVNKPVLFDPQIQIIQNEHGESQSQINKKDLLYLQKLQNSTNYHNKLFKYLNTLFYLLIQICQLIIAFYLFTMNKYENTNLQEQTDYFDLQHILIVNPKSSCSDILNICNQIDLNMQNVQFERQYQTTSQVVNTPTFVQSLCSYCHNETIKQDSLDILVQSLLDSVQMSAIPILGSLTFNIEQHLNIFFNKYQLIVLFGIVVFMIQLTLLSGNKLFFEKQLKLLMHKIKQILIYLQQLKITSCISQKNNIYQYKVQLEKSKKFEKQHENQKTELIAGALPQIKSRDQYCDKFLTQIICIILFGTVTVLCEYMSIIKYNIVEQLFQQVCGRRLIELRGLFYVINFVETKQCQACQYFHFAPNKNNANNE